jgi:hypothetical protein
MSDMTYRLVVVYRSNSIDSYRVQWEYDEDGSWEQGAICGEDPRLLKRKKPPTNSDDWDMWITDNAIQALKPERDDYGFWFESKKEAQVALRAAKEALKSGKPWPDWVIQAKAAGWKVPKGWKS